MVHLTAREQQILTLVATKGLTNAAVASLIGCTERTVKVHVSRLFTKLNVTNRVQAVLTFHNIAWRD